MKSLRTGILLLGLSLGSMNMSCAWTRPFYRSMPPTPAGAVSEVYSPKMSLADDVLAEIGSLDSVVDASLSASEQVTRLVEIGDSYFEPLLNERPLEGFSDKQVRGFETYMRNIRAFPQFAFQGLHHYGVPEYGGRDRYQSARYEMERLWDDYEVRSILPRRPTPSEMNELEKRLGARLSEEFNEESQPESDNWYQDAQNWWITDFRINKAKRELRAETYDFFNIVREAWLKGISENYKNAFGYYDLALRIAPDDMSDDIRAKIVEKHLELSEWYANPPEAYRLNDNIVPLEDNEMFAVFEAFEGIMRADRETQPYLAARADLTLAYALSGSWYYADRARAFDVYYYVRDEINQRCHDKGYTQKDKRVLNFINSQVAWMRTNNLLYRQGIPSAYPPGLLFFQFEQPAPSSLFESH